MSYEPPKCRACGQIICFIPMKSGKKMPCDSFSLWVLPATRGRIYFDGSGNTVRGIVSTKDEPRSVQVWEPHWATCRERERKPTEAQINRDKQRERIREQIMRERREAAERAERKVIREKEAREQQAAQDAQCTLFGRYEAE